MYFKHFPSQVLFARVCGKIEIFFLLAFEKGKFVLVYGLQGKLDKCTKNTSMVLANKRRPWREILRFAVERRDRKFYRAV
jgi:hypothetical protein